MTAPTPPEPEPTFMWHSTTRPEDQNPGILRLRLACAEERRDAYAADCARYAAENIRLRAGLDRLQGTPKHTPRPHPHPRHAPPETSPQTISRPLRAARKLFPTPIQIHHARLLLRRTDRHAHIVADADCCDCHDGLGCRVSRVRRVPDGRQDGAGGRGESDRVDSGRRTVRGRPEAVSCTR